MRCVMRVSPPSLRDDPLARLSGHGCDLVEVVVVVHHNHACRLAGCSHEQIGHLAAALMALCEQPLHLSCPTHMLGCGLDELKGL